MGSAHGFSMVVVPTRAVAILRLTEVLRDVCGLKTLTYFALTYFGNCSSERHLPCGMPFRRRPAGLEAGGALASHGSAIQAKCDDRPRL